MLTIPQAIRRIKGRLTQFVPAALVASLGQALGRRYRRRTLTPEVVTYLFLRQVLHGNPAVGEVRHLSGLDFTDSAYCQARQRLPVGYFHRLARAVTGASAGGDEPTAAQRWHGHRVFLLDGSSFSMPDTPELQETFGQPGAQAAGCGFPVAHLLVLFDAHAGFLLKAVPSPLRTHDLSQAAVAHAELRRGDVLVGDRAFCSYAHLALCRQRGLHGLFRAHQKLLVDFRPGRRWASPGTPAAASRGLPRSQWLRRLGRRDQWVEYHKPKERPSWMSAADYAALAETLVLREVRFRVGVPGRRTREITLVTTLLDARRYPARALARLYERRWRAEVNLRHLKQTLGMDVLRCETVPGVMKELLVFVTVYNLVCRIQREAGRRQGVAPERISFVDALRWLRSARSGEELPRLVVNPERPGRVEPRVRKRRPKQYPLMRKPRETLRKAALGKQHAA
jgi:hypothetical protein